MFKITFKKPTVKRLARSFGLKLPKRSFTIWKGGALKHFLSVVLRIKLK